MLRKPIEQATYTEDDRKTYHGKTFTVLEVIDGDTIDIDWPDGDFPNTRVRLLGVDTPETKHPKTGVMHFGPEASAFTEKMTLGKEVTLYLDSVGDHRGYYGRLLAYVHLPDGTVLNEELIKQGYGYAYLSFQHSQFDPYADYMETAIKEKKGLWQNATRDDLPKWLKSKRPDLLRYPKSSDQ
ncbi:MAG: thermonuclease family protein [Planctomycetota bacterium]